MANTATQPTHHVCVQVQVTLDLRWQDGDLLSPEYLAKAMVSDWADDCVSPEAYEFCPSRPGDEPTSNYMVRVASITASPLPGTE